MTTIQLIDLSFNILLTGGIITMQILTMQARKFHERRYNELWKAHEVCRNTIAYVLFVLQNPEGKKEDFHQTITTLLKNFSDVKYGTNDQ